MFENLTQLNMTSIFLHNWSHQDKHFLLFMNCWNETEKWLIKCIKADVDTLIFIFWVSEFLLMAIFGFAISIQSSLLPNFGRNPIKDIIPISVIIVVIGSLYATIKFTVIDFKNGRFGQICFHQPPCRFFANTPSRESEQTSVAASPDNKTKSASNVLHEDIELVDRPRSRSFSGTFSKRKPNNRSFHKTSLNANIENLSDSSGQDEISNCTYKNIIIARTKNLKPR